MPSPVRVGGFTLRIACNHCGQPVPLNAPARRTLCSSCLGDIALPDAIWEAPLNDFEDSQDRNEVGDFTRSRDIGGFQLHYEFKQTLPKCEKCGHEYPADRVEAGKELHCTACGHAGAVVPAPDWLRALVSSASELFLTDEAVQAMAGDAAGVAQVTPPEAPNPVVMACPQCGASLRITNDMARVCPCSYCKTDVYLPDDLWRRLHPVKVVREWYVCFRGKTRGQLTAEARDRFNAIGLVRQRAEQERVYAESVEAEHQRDVEVARVMPRAYWMVAGLYVLLLAAAAMNFGLGLTGNPNVPVGIASLGVCLVTIAAAYYVTSIPIMRRTGHGDDMVVFISIFALLMPVVGQVMAFVMAIKRFGGAFGGPSALDGGEAYPRVQLKGEGIPLGCVYLSLAILWPATLGSVIYTLQAPSAPSAQVAPVAPPPSPAAPPARGSHGRGR